MTQPSKEHAAAIAEMRRAEAEDRFEKNAAETVRLQRDGNRHQRRVAARRERQVPQRQHGRQRAESMTIDGPAGE